MNFIACSSCFNDYGFKLEVIRHGTDSEEICPVCKNYGGAKITRDDLLYVCHSFFVDGSTFKTPYGAAPLIQFNEHQKNSILLTPELNDDIERLSDILGIGFFDYGPRLWMLGEIEPLKQLQNIKTRKRILEKIVDTYPEQQLTPKDIFFRIRKSPQTPSLKDEYDSPPKKIKRKYGRLDSRNVQLMYASTDIDICIHECRFTAEDDVFVASIVPKQELSLLNLCALLDEEGTEFESLDLSVYMLFLAGEHSYSITRGITKVARLKGYDGIIYPSFLAC